MREEQPSTRWQLSGLAENSRIEPRVPQKGSEGDMTLQKSKEQLIQLLAQEDNAVIALSGRW